MRWLSAYSSVKKSSSSGLPASAAWWKKRMSPPAQKAPNGPSLLTPRMATAMTPGSSRQASSVVLSVRIISSESALSALGRLRVMRPTRPCTSTMTVGSGDDMITSPRDNSVCTLGGVQRLDAWGAAARAPAQQFIDEQRTDDDGATDQHRGARGLASADPRQQDAED